MSQDLANFDSDHLVMKALRTNRDWLTQQLGGEPPDNPTVPTISEIIITNPTSPTELQKILSERLSGLRRKAGTKLQAVQTGYVSTAREARTRRHGSWRSSAHPTSQWRTRF